MVQQNHYLNNLLIQLLKLKSRHIRCIRSLHLRMLYTKGTIQKSLSHFSMLSTIVMVGFLLLGKCKTLLLMKLYAAKTLPIDMAK